MKGIQSISEQIGADVDNNDDPRTISQMLGKNSSKTRASGLASGKARNPGAMKPASRRLVRLTPLITAPFDSAGARPLPHRGLRIWPKGPSDEEGSGH